MHAGAPDGRPTRWARQEPLAHRSSARLAQRSGAVDLVDPALADGPQDLVNGRDAALRLRQRVLRQADSPILPYGLTEAMRRSRVCDRLSNRSRDRNRLVDADPSAVPGVMTLIASDRLEKCDGVQRLVTRTRRMQRTRPARPAARHAQSPHQSLNDNADGDNDEYPHEEVS